MKIQTACFDTVFISCAQGELVRPNRTLPRTEILNQYIKLYTPHPLVIINKSTKIEAALEKALVLMIVASPSFWRARKDMHRNLSASQNKQRKNGATNISLYVPSRISPNHFMHQSHPQYQHACGCNFMWTRVTLCEHKPFWAKTSVKLLEGKLLTDARVFGAAFKGGAPAIPALLGTRKTLQEMESQMAFLLWLTAIIATMCG